MKSKTPTSGASGFRSKDASGLVISYLRFSTPEQAKGDSTRRQIEAGKEWAEARGLTITDNLEDRGISAYRGANKAGALGHLLKQIEEKKIPKGSILLVESLDRLSREECIRAIHQFTGIINSGMTIVTLQDGKEYSPENTEMIALMYSLMVMGAANEESKKKSHRLKAAWGNKKKNADKKVVTPIVPAWLRVEDGAIKVDKAKAKVVQLIYKMSSEGSGHAMICKALNNGLGNIGRTKTIGKSYVAKILHNRAVLGEYQPHKKVWENGRYNRYHDGAAVMDYFPRVITDELWYATRKTLDSRKKTGGPSTFVNLWSGLFSGIQHINKGYGRFYASTDHINGVPGSNASIFPVDQFDRSCLMALANWELFPKPEIETPDNAGTVNALLVIQGKIAELTKALDDVGPVKAIATKLAALEGEEEKLKASVAVAKHYQQSTEDESRAYCRAFQDVMMGKGDRLALRERLRRMVKSVSASFSGVNGCERTAEVKIAMNDGRLCKITINARRISRLKRDKLGHPVKSNLTGDPIWQSDFTEFWGTGEKIGYRIGNLPATH